MALTRISREEMVEQSVEGYLAEKLYTERDYPTAQVQIVDAFQEKDFGGPLDKNYLALGFNFDDGGRQAELGSDLLARTYTIEVWVIGRTPSEGKNLANAVRDSLEEDGRLPLRDYRLSGAPVIDHLFLGRVRADRQPIANPKPWQEALWIVTIQVDDLYYASNPFS